MSTISSRAGWVSRRAARTLGRTRQLSTFEKAIVANSAIIVLVTAAGWWITQHNPETYHYLIDTGFIAAAALAALIVNFVLLRAAFAPLYGVLATIRAVEAGDLEARAAARHDDADALALARAFNAMLDRLALARDETAARVLRAQEEERRRLALELHDQTGQSLTALTLHAEALVQRLSSERSEAAAQARIQASQVSALAQQTLAEVQALSRQLRPSMLDDLGLPAALRWLADDADERLGVQAQVRTEVSERLPSEVEIALYRIAQESLTNAVRHGRACHVRIALRRREESVTLTVADDGIGSASSRDGHIPPASGGLGLAGMRERVHPLGGRVVVRSQPGHGWVVRAVVPLDTAARAQPPLAEAPDELTYMLAAPITQVDP
jgi:two-component system, NarL family, sensor histidine kinase UhpB